MNVNHNERIDYLLAKFYAVESSTAENDELFEYFLYTNPLPDCYADDMPLIRAFAIMRYCKTTEAEFRQSLKAARQTAETRKRLVPKPVLRIAAAAACVAAIAIGFWAISTDAVPTVPTYDMLQPTQVAQAEVPAKQHTQQLNAETDTTTTATATDNEIKNTADHTTNKHNHTRYAENESATPRPDIIATAPIEQEHIPVLLAENETQIEQNLVAEGNNDNISTSPVYTSELLAFDNTDINNIDNEQYWQLAEFDTFCNTRCTDMQVVETITRTLI